MRIISKGLLLIVLAAAWIAAAHADGISTKGAISGSFDNGIGSGARVTPNLAPVVHNATFGISLPVSGGYMVGTVSSSDSPFSWAITAGNPGGGTPWFAIDNSGNLTVTAAGATGLGTSTGTATLTVAATNAAGTGTGTVHINYSPALPPPVVLSASFGFSTPIVAATSIGTMTATNSPTSWSITGVAPIGQATWYAISNAGVITVTSAGATGLDNATASVVLTVQATNATGSGSGTATFSYIHPPPPIPVVSPATFLLPLPTTTSTAVGTATATSSPTSWAITAGDPGGGTPFYAIDSSGNITITAAGATGLDNSAGSDSLTVAATNVTGTGTGTMTVIHEPGPVPAVNNATLSLTLPSTTGESVGTMTATNSPTSWAITAGNAAGYFAIDNSGLITVTSAGSDPVTGLIANGTAVLTVVATNANGAGPAGSATINYAAGPSFCMEYLGGGPPLPCVLRSPPTWDVILVGSAPLAVQNAILLGLP